jgi:hypothetical protein
MDRSKIEEKLHELATSSTGRSETDRLRDVFPSVEKAFAAGVGRKAVLETLHADGFTMSMKMFDKALYRIRKETKAKRESIPDRNTTRTETPASNTPRRFVHNPTPREDLLD